jgi:hypothetical protein
VRAKALILRSDCRESAIERRSSFASASNDAGTTDTGLVNISTDWAPGDGPA